MKKQGATVYRRKGQLLISASSQTPGRYGLWIDAGPYFVVSEADAPDLIGRRLEEALKASRQDVPYPENPEDLEKPLLDLAGVKSWDAFVREATHSYVERDAEGFRIVPSRNDGGGFVPRSDDAIRLRPDSMPDAVGKALLDALRE